jgi:orotate phosphoribosyltransferase
MNSNDFKELLAMLNVVVTGNIFVYKSGFIGTAYVNKEELALQGGPVINSCVISMAQNAYFKNMKFDPDVKTVLLIGPAYGAIGYPYPVSEYLSKYYPNIVFIPGRTQLDNKGNHYIPEKFKEKYFDCDEFIILEDIINAGTTIKEVSSLLPKRVHSTICLVDRGNNTATKLGIENFFPFISINMDMFDPRIDPSLFNSGLQINTELGKGKLWLEQLGLPPYSDDADFSAFSLFK